jgi:hypothetical protein
MTTQSPAGFRCVKQKNAIRRVQLMDRPGEKTMCYNVASPSSWYNVHIKFATTIKTCNCHTAFWPVDSLVTLRRSVVDFPS